MTMPELYAINKAQPFVPFKLHLDNGQTVEVKSEGDALIPPRGRHVVVYQYHIPEHLVVIFGVEQINDLTWDVPQATLNTSS